MFVDERIYTLHAGKVPVFLKLYREEGRLLGCGDLGFRVRWALKASWRW